MGQVNGEKFEHRLDLEDYWANAANNFEIRKRFWSRIPLNLIRASEVFRVVDQLEEENEYEQPHFANLKNEPLALVDCTDSERSNLGDLMRPMIEYSKWWTAQRTKELKARNITLTYDLMGIDESMSSNHYVTSNSPRNPKSVGSRKRKEPTESSIRAKGKITGEVDMSRQQSQMKVIQL